MRAAAIVLLVAACGRATPAATPPISQHATEPTAVEPPRTLQSRHLSVGTHEITASRSIWELSIDGGTASLVETDLEAPGPLTIEQADRETRWTTTRTHAQKGPVRRAGDRIALDLATDVDSLFLHCWHRTIAVATAGARRVPRPGHERDCDDPGTWSPAATKRVDVLVCGQEEAPGDFSDLETHWYFTAAPGVELVEQIDDCLQSQGLRLAK